MATLLRDLRRSWPLLRVLAKKEFLVRYRRASFGVVWALALPLLQAGVLALVLPKFVRFDVDGSYVLFVLAGSTVWAFFSTSINDGTASIVAAQDISTRVYFPRLVLPLTVVLSNLYALLPGIAVLAGAALVDHGPMVRLLWLAPAVALGTVLVASLASVLSALHVYFRDVRYIVQASLIPWFYLTPVFYPLDAIGGLRPWIEANPITGVVQLARAGTVGIEGPWLTSVAWTLGWSASLFVVALLVHRRHDRIFVDLL
ncbi:MAG: ABC transporter permease [Actinomycetota bacterium]|nr:ABC transporter permease [Actinomycetota bacterium]